MIQIESFVFIASHTLSVFTALTGGAYYIWTPVKLLVRNASSSSSVTPFCMLIHILALSPHWSLMDQSSLLREASVGVWTFSVMESQRFFSVAQLLESHCSISLAHIPNHSLYLPLSETKHSQCVHSYSLAILLFALSIPSM